MQACEIREEVNATEEANLVRVSSQMILASIVSFYS
jgi:hypothetical protein